MRTKDEVKADVGRLVKERTDWSIAEEAVIGIQVVTIVGEYVDHFFDADAERFETIEVEAEVRSDVVNPSTGRPSTRFDHVSKLDVIAFDRFARETIIVEHKSSSDDLTPGSPYWRRLSLDSQVSKYLLSLRQSGAGSVRSCLYDVAAKPGTGPKAIPSKDVRELAESGEYHGLKASWATQERISELYKASRGDRGGFTGKAHERDFLELYGLRLRSLIRERQEAFFGRLVLTRTDEELELYARELWELTAEIRKSRLSPISPRNSGACWNFNRPCEFFDVCTGSAEIEDRSLFERPGQVHVELDEEFENGGREIVTNSRIGTFLTCREKHRLRFEEGFRPLGRSESTALIWGDLFHKALEIVWNEFKREER